MMDIEIIATSKPIGRSDLPFGFPDAGEAIEAALLDIGLNRKEVLIYKTLLALGPRPASVLAKQAGFNRSRTYDHLAVLKARGFVETYRRNGVLRFGAISPAAVIAILKSRRERFEQIITACESALKAFAKQPAVDYNSGIPVDFFDF